MVSRSHTTGRAVNQRWNTSDVDALLSGLKRSRVHQPFGVTHEGLVDLRGLPLPTGITLKEVHFENCDLSNASMCGAWIEKSLFVRVRFDDADLTGIKDHGNQFIESRFVQTDCREAAIGYRGSVYQQCRFDAVDFRRAIFIRAEFDECRFVDCRLKGVDFNASSFVRCSFVGVLEDVWFRGGFPLPSDSEEFGQPRPNAMKQVSFEKADLHDITFSDQCDLSAIVVPSTGEYRLYQSWKTRLERLGEVSREWSPKDRQEADVFVNSSMPHAQNQDWELLNCEDVRNEHGRDLGDRIIRALDGS